MKLQKPKGTNDILPGESAKWALLENFVRDSFASYNYQEIRTPMFEHYEVISRSVGDTSDIVTKEMYDFHDKGDRHVTLRPEGTAPVVRAYVENKLYGPQVQKPTKMFYIGPMFRYERPQAGRLRQFHQVGVECFGAKNPAIDVETIAMANDFFNQIGIEGVKLHLNTLGDTETRNAYRTALIDYLTPFKDQLSEDSRRRLDQNPLRVLDSKEPEDKALVENAPKITDFLSDDSAAYFQDVQDMLKALEIDYVIDTNMVRGLDYYNDTIFEFIVPVGKTELTICAGGRYDGLVEYFDGPATPAFGWGMGMERLLMLIEAQGIELPIDSGLNVYVAVLGSEANAEALKLVQALRYQGFAADRDYLGRKIKAQFTSAEAFNADVIITLGGNEVETRQVQVKNNRTRKTVDTTLDAIYDSFIEVYEEAISEEEGE
jgi:histidyl-tRNA synthetase